MQKHVIVMIEVALLMLALYDLPGQTADIYAASAEVSKLIFQGKYFEAIPIAENAVQTAKNEFGEYHKDYASNLNNLAALYYLTGQYAKAEPLYIKAIEIRKRVLGEHHPEYAGSLNNLAALYKTMSQYKKAEPLYKQAMEIRERTLGKNNPEYAQSLNNMAALYDTLGQYVKAELLYKQAMEIIRKILGQDHPDYALSLNGLAFHYYSLGQYDKSELLYKQAMEIDRKTLGTDHPSYATNLNNLAVLYNAIGQHEKAESLYKQAMEIRKKALGKDHPSYATSLNNLATFYESLGRYEKSEPLYKQAMETDRKTLGTDHPSYATSINNLALLYHEMGQYEKAEPLYKQAIGIFRNARGQEHPDYAMSLGNLALLYQEINQYEKAEPLYKQVIEVIGKTLGENHSSYATSISNLAGLYHSMGQCEKAEPLYNQALYICEKALGIDHPDYATSLNNLAVLYAAMEKYDKAEFLYKQAMEIGRQTLGENHPHYATTLKNLALLYAAIGKFELALDYQNTGMTAEQRKIRTVFPYLTEKERQAYLDTVKNSLDILLTMCALNGSNPAFRTAALDWVLKRKGIILSTLLEDRERFRLMHNVGTKDMLKKLAAVQSKLAKLVYAGPDKEGAEAFKSKCDSMRSEIESIQKSLATVSASYAGNLVSTDANTASVSSALTKGAALVEMVSYKVSNIKAKCKESKWKENRFVCFVLLPGEKIPSMVDLGDATKIDEAVRKFRKAVSDKSGEAEYGKEVYELVWSKIEPYLSGVNYVFISPDSDLNLLSFASLPTSDGSYLCEKYIINTIASGRDLLRKQIVAGSKTGFVAIADPEFDPTAQTKYVAVTSQSVVTYRSALANRGIFSNVRLSPLPTTREEVNSAEAMFKAKGIGTKTLFGADATETAVKSLSKPGYLLLSTHGFFLEDPSWTRERKESSSIGSASGPTKVSLALENPMHRSGLVFAGAQRAVNGDQIPEGEDDGLLTAEEVVTMDMEGTKLVNLSACETGLGEVKRGEGVMGLRRAFVMAGCNSLLMSLWSVPDKSTKELMNAFYAQYLKSYDPVRSLTEAQRGMLKTRRSEGRPTNPYYWGAFVATAVIGKYVPATITEPEPDLRKYEIELIGRVDSIDADGKRMNVIVNRIRTPGQKAFTLNTTRSKVIYMNKSVKWLRRDANVLIIGKQTGVGKPMTADIVVASPP